MKLTFILFRRNRLPNGHLFRGKDRLVKKVEPKHLRQLKRDFETEEKNMFYLRFPYLTEVNIINYSVLLIIISPLGAHYFSFIAGRKLRPCKSSWQDVSNAKRKIIR